MPLRLYILPYWSNPPFLIFDIRISKILNGGLDKYGTEPLEQHQFGTAGVEGVNAVQINKQHNMFDWHHELWPWMTLNCPSSKSLNLYNYFKNGDRYNVVVNRSRIRHYPVHQNTVFINKPTNKHNVNTLITATQLRILINKLSTFNAVQIHKHHNMFVRSTNHRRKSMRFTF